MSAEPDAAESPQVPSGDEITEDEFEALLDQLHGPGKHGGTPAGNAAAATETPKAAAPAPEPKQPAEPAKPAVAAKVAEPATAKPEAPKKAAAETAAKPAAKAAKSKAPAKPTGDTSVRVDTRRLDDIMNMVGELVLVRNRLSLLKATMADENLASVVGNLDVVTSDLQLAVMKTRMQPVKKVLGRFPRVVRDLARNLTGC